MFSVSNMNILDKLTKPLEFQGKIGTHELNGQEVNADAIKQHFLDTLTSEQVKVRSLGDKDITQKAIELDERQSLTFKELMSDHSIQFLEQLVQTKAQTLDPDLKKETLENFEKIKEFFDRIKDLKIDRFLVEAPHNITYPDGKAEVCDDQPVVNNTYLLDENKTAEQLIDDLAKDSIERVFDYTDPNRTPKLKELIDKSYTPEKLKELFDTDGISPNLLAPFTSQIGTTVLLFLYHALYLHKVASKGVDELRQLNQLKLIFKNTIGNNAKRAETIRHQLIEAKISLFFTQECDTHVTEALSSDFVLPEGQNTSDGTQVFLKKKEWKDIRVVNEDLDLDKWTSKGKINAVFAEHISSNTPYLLVSAHGHSKDETDAQAQLAQIHKAYTQLKEQYPNIRLILGIDANCKKTFEAFEEQIKSLELHYTDKLGYTTRKQRAITVQFSKAGEPVESKGDYLISSEPLQNQHLGIIADKDLDPNAMLPNIDNQSDHFAVTAMV